MLVPRAAPTVTHLSTHHSLPGNSPVPMATHAATPTIGRPTPELRPPRPGNKDFKQLAVPSAAAPPPAPPAPGSSLERRRGEEGKVRPGVPGCDCGTGVAAAPDSGAPRESADSPGPRPQPGGRSPGSSPAPLRPDTPRGYPGSTSSPLSRCRLPPRSPRASRPGAPAPKPRPCGRGTERLPSLPGDALHPDRPPWRCRRLKRALCPKRAPCLMSASFLEGSTPPKRPSDRPLGPPWPAPGLGPFLVRTLPRSAADPGPRQSPLGQF
ncbi:translation initiation factor IF-2-like [Mesocricetus auratus]|uniref:Translation initiation factor IF-2-like n=1 Tax=Mesocricetus auratus TaxID=10036 RepID=A0ABM2W2G8_MESAU|nr:translation initiation factor IF-2-like [Mesocricetus auratus]